MRQASDSFHRGHLPTSSSEVIRALEAAGWVEVRTKGSHHHFKHPTRPGTVTVPHPEKDLPLGTLKSIEKHAGLKLRPAR